MEWARLRDTDCLSECQNYIISGSGLCETGWQTAGGGCGKNGWCCMENSIGDTCHTNASAASPSGHHCVRKGKDTVVTSREA